MYFKLIRITYYLAHGEANVCVRVFMHAYPRVFTCVMYSSSFATFVVEQLGNVIKSALRTVRKDRSNQ